MKRVTTRIALPAAALTLALALALPAAALAHGPGPGPGGPCEYGGPGGPGGPGHGPGGPGHGPRGPHFMHMLRDLDLTDAQRTQARALADEARKAIEPLMDQLHASRKAFDATRDPAVFDEAALRAQLKKDAALHEEIAVIQARTAAKAVALLTDEQRAELRAEITARRERRRDDVH